jgi:hypothetical protein
LIQRFGAQGDARRPAPAASLSRRSDLRTAHGGNRQGSPVPLHHERALMETAPRSVGAGQATNCRSFQRFAGPAAPTLALRTQVWSHLKPLRSTLDPWRSSSFGPACWCSRGVSAGRPRGSASVGAETAPVHQSLGSGHSRPCGFGPQLSGSARSRRLLGCLHTWPAQEVDNEKPFPCISYNDYLDNNTLWHLACTPSHFVRVRLSRCIGPGVLTPRMRPLTVDG